MRPMRRFLIYASVLTLTGALFNGVLPAGMALAASPGPSVPLPETDSTTVEKQAMDPRPKDQASENALTGNQTAPKAPKDGAGTVEATPLSPSATWQVSTQTGDFSWSYPLRVPPAAGGLAPDLTLSYTSSAVDGRTSATNNQPSWVGDGWALSSGFIQRNYLPCADDDRGDVKPGKVGDLCWGSDNANVAFSGGAGMLIRDPAGDDADGEAFRNKSEDGSRIRRLTGAGNGDDNGEHWKITTTDGTQYFFGSRADAKSTWTVPVFGDDTGEPCHGSGFDASHCVQGWRWNLDKVVDRNGNMMLYNYDQETNSYGLNLKDAAVPYVRSGTLREIQYGLMAGDPNVPASGRVAFATADRCVPGSDCRPALKDNWPDVPWDYECSGATCPDKHSPSFWSTKRLAKVTTQVRRNGAFADVDSWTLDQQFPDPGDGGKAALWLKSITHTGLVKGSISLPAVTFEGTKKANRVYQTDGYAPLVRYRITGIVSESGGVLEVVYAEPNCVPGSSMPAKPESNTLRCFPQNWNTKDFTPRTDYFHKYVVAQVTESDRTSSSTEKVTSYSYGDAAWHFNTAEFMKEDKRSWDDFRGFGKVAVRTGSAGDPAGPIGKTEHWFYRGMNGDKYPKDADHPDGVRSASVDPSEGGPRIDEDWLQGFELESVTYLGDTTTVVQKTINDPYWRGPLATRDVYKSYLVRTGATQQYTALAAGGRRSTRTETKYDDRGLETEVNNLGDLATAQDDQCTTTTYASNAGRWLREFPRRVETVGVRCGATPVFPGDAIRDVKYAYDDGDFAAAPTAGNETRVDELKTRPAGGDPGYVTTSRKVYDANGRATKSTDAMGRITVAAYTPARGGPTTQRTVTNAVGHVVTTTLDPAWGAETLVSDPNARKTETAYDALGRATEVWLPNRPRESNDGNFKFSYRVNKENLSVVSTTAVGPNGNYTTTNTVYDGLLRIRQVQKPAPGGGRLLTDTRYDSQGRAFKVSQPYFNNAAVDDQLWLAADSNIAKQALTQFDGAGRTVQQIVLGGGAELWRTTITYGGDRVNVMPPRGGTATTTISDAQGRTVELRQYQGGSLVGAYDATKYTYTKAGQAATVTDTAGNVWRNKYDLRGNLKEADDPDKGLSTMTYDEAGQLKTATDARAVTMSFDYDDLGRKTSLKSGTTVLATWTYDTAIKGKGMLASATSYVGKAEYTRKVGAYTAINKPKDTSIVIPDAEGSLGGTYTTESSYNPDGSLYGMAVPKIGDMPAETVSVGYDDLADQTTLTGGVNGTTVKYVSRTDYTRYGELARVQMGVEGARAWQSYYYGTNTRRLERAIVDAEVSHPMQSDVHLSYDPYGNVTSATDATVDAEADVQCFQYDYVQRLTEAWTPAAGCDKSPDVNGLGGPAPYWQSFTYDAIGNRRTDTQHAAAGDTKRTYGYPATGARVPESLTTTTPAGTTKDDFGYDAIGNSISRFGQKLDWDLAGKLVKVSESGKATEFVHDASGNRLVRRDPAGSTLYLDGQELRLDKASGKLLATRYYQFAGNTVAMRTDTGVTWLGADHQATAQVAIDAADPAKVVKRRQTPFGAPRGTAVSFPGEKGFVGGTVDASTGLVHLGARDYDPRLGQFLSVDPVLDTGNPQQMHGYSYSANDPITRSDPTGLYAPSCNKFGDCTVGKRGPDPAPQPPPASRPKSAPPRTSPPRQPICNNQGDCRAGAYGKTPGPALNCDLDGDCRAGVKGPSPEELARRADHASWVESTKSVQPPYDWTPTMFAFCISADVQAWFGHAGENCLAFDGEGVGWIRGDKNFAGPAAGLSANVGIKISNGDIPSQKGYDSAVGGGLEVKAGGVDVGAEVAVSDADGQKAGPYSVGASAGVGPGGGVNVGMGRGNSLSDYYFRWDWAPPSSVGDGCGMAGCGDQVVPGI